MQGDQRHPPEPVVGRQLPIVSQESSTTCRQPATPEAPLKQGAAETLSAKVAQAQVDRLAEVSPALKQAAERARRSLESADQAKHAQHDALSVQAKIVAAIHRIDQAMSDVMLADVATAQEDQQTSPEKPVAPPDSKLPLTLSNASWKRRQRLPLTIIVPPTPWADSPPAHEHAIGLRVAPVTWRNRVFDRKDEPRSRYFPSWLTSLVLHLVLMVILGSLASAPVQKFAQRGLQLLVSTTHEPDTRADLVAFEMGPRRDLTSNNLNLNQSSTKVSADNPFDNPVDNDRVKVPEIRLVNIKEEAQNQVMQPRPAANLANNAATANTPTIISRQSPNFGGAMTALDTAPVTNRPISEQQMDEVVERFTQYDIGKLRGEAGEQARRDFQALGPEAIPSLVRGLNKAARLSASCPVLVIRRKLDNSLEVNTDPTALKYAIDNLGRDIPKSAQHKDVIKSLKDKWVTKNPPVVKADPQTLADILIAHGIPPTDRLRMRMQKLVEASTDTLSRALVSNTDKDDPVAATAIIIQRQGAFAEHLRPKLIRGLIRQLKNEGTRLATVKALALLVDYANHKPRDLPSVNFGEKSTLDGPTAKLVDTAQRMEMFAGPLPPYRRYRPLVVEFLEATDANLPEVTAAK